MSTSRLRRTAAAVALAVLALTGCSVNQAGAASVVGGQVVSDSDVASYVDEVRTQLDGIKGATFDEKSATIAGLTQLTRHLILAAAAQKEGITVTQGQVDGFIENVVQTQFSGQRQALVDNLAQQSDVPESQIPAAARDQLVYNALVSKIAPGASDSTAVSDAFTKYMTPFVAQLGVQVAPRYGTWNVFSLGPVPEDLAFTPQAASGGQGTPAPAPSPTG